MAKFHVHDVGSILEVMLLNKGVPVNLLQVTVLQLELRKPGSAANIIRNAEKVTDGADGKICYAWQEGDLDVVGTWLLTIYIESPTLKLHSDILQFEVDGNL